VARTDISDATDLTIADVLHKQFEALPADATVADVREWFATSSHRRMAFLADQGRYTGSLTREDLEGDLDSQAPAAEFAHDGPTVAPDAAAHVGYALATKSAALRVPAVDAAGNLVGVVAVTNDRAGFCGTS
jgi:CBS-domain-containing membrane protein